MSILVRKWNEVLDILESEGADPSQIVICHSDVEMNLNYMISVMKRGALLNLIILEKSSDSY